MPAPSRCDQHFRVSLARRFARAAAALAGSMLISAGCYSPGYQQPYGYNSYPPAYQTYPAPGYPVDGTMQPGYGGGTTLGTPTYDNTQPTPSGGGDAPYYGSPMGSTGNRPVPDSGYGDVSGTSYIEGSGGAGGADWTDPSTIPAGDTEQYQPPIDANPISFERDVSAVSKTPYGFAPDYSWIQGVVSYDQRQSSWGIVYDINPQHADPHSGYLTLAADPRLESLKNGDAVRLQGRLESSARDPRDRPLYAVETVTPISL